MQWNVNIEIEGAEPGGRKIAVKVTDFSIINGPDALRELIDKLGKKAVKMAEAGETK